jgi:hypothetical protein
MQRHSGTAASAIALPPSTNELLLLLLPTKEQK